MWRAMTLIAFGLSISLTAPPAQAGLIGNACLKANRPSANRALCSCIDKVAQQTLTRAERRKAAKFFSDPHKAQKTRQSDRASDERLWKNYKRFGQQATKTCG